MTDVEGRNGPRSGAPTGEATARSISPPRSKSARDRTQAHLRTLVALAASGLALGACGSSGEGYGVVDPMPPPSRCEGTAALFHATASWKTVGTVRLLEIVLTAPADRADLTLGATATTSIGSIMQTKTEGSATTILVDPQASTSFTVTVPLTCKAGGANIGVAISPPTDGSETLVVNLYDQT